MTKGTWQGKDERAWVTVAQHLAVILFLMLSSFGVVNSRTFMLKRKMFWTPPLPACWRDVQSHTPSHSK